MGDGWETLRRTLAAGPGRRQVLEAIAALPDVDGVVAVSYAVVDGEQYHTRVEAAGAEPFVAVFSALDGRRSVTAELIDPRRPGRIERDAFTSLTPSQHQALAESPLGRDCLAPARVSDQLRMLVYDDDAFVDWVEVVACDGRTLTLEVESGLTRLAAAIAAALKRAARAHHRKCCPGTLLVSGQGAIEGWTDGSEGWLTPERIRRLGLAVAEARPDGGVVVVDGHVVHARPIRGAGSMTLCKVAPALAPRVAPDAALSARERELARLAAAGTSVSDIAGRMGVTQQTARTYMKRVYAALGVKSRLELARLMGQPDAAAGR